MTVIDPAMHFSKDVLLTKIQHGESNFFLHKDYTIPDLTQLQKGILYNIFIEPLSKKQAAISLNK